MSNKDLRARLFKGGERARETVTLLTEDGPAEVDVVALSGNARGKVMNDCLVQSTDEEDEDGDPKTEMDMVKLNATLVIECVYVKGTDERLFTEGDREAIGECSASYFDPVIKVATRLSGIGRSAMKAVEGNSALTTDSTSDSPSHAS